MNKKSFKNNAAMNFISQESIDQVEQPEKAPEGYKVNHQLIECKSKRVQILIQPSVHEQLKVKAEAAGQSVNEIINKALIEYIEKH